VEPKRRIAMISIEKISSHIVALSPKVFSAFVKTVFLGAQVTRIIVKYQQS